VGGFTGQHLQEAGEIIRRHVQLAGNKFHRRNSLLGQVLGCERGLQELIEPVDDGMVVDLSGDELPVGLYFKMRQTTEFTYL
jgi:hypothetical protein